MDKYLGLKDDEKVSVAGDQSQYQQQQSSTLSTEDESAAGHEKKVPFGSGGGDGGSISTESESEAGKEHKQQGSETDTSRTIPPFTEGYGTTGSPDSSEPGEKHHGFANAV